MAGTNMNMPGMNMPGMNMPGMNMPVPNVPTTTAPTNLPTSFVPTTMTQMGPMATGQQGKIPMDYETFFRCGHYANTKIPYNYSLRITFSQSYLPTDYVVSDVVNGLTQNVMYSDNVTYNIFNYDGIANAIDKRIPGNENYPVQMSKIPDGLQSAIVNYIMTTMNNSSTTPLMMNNPYAMPALNASSGLFVDTTHIVTILVDSDLNTIFTVTGFFGGIRKFVDEIPLLSVPPVFSSWTPITWNNMAITPYVAGKKFIPVAVPDLVTYPGDHYYEIAVVQYNQQLHTDMKATTLRGFVQVHGHDASGNPLYDSLSVSQLGPMIFAKKDVPVRVKLYNLLPLMNDKTSGKSGKSLIPYDDTFMGAGAGPDGTKYSENRTVIHLHGGNTPWISDGTANQWIAPKGEITHFTEGASNINVPDMPQCMSGSGIQTYYYTNNQSARFMWYHDHSYGSTRLGVYMGIVSGYSLSDDVELSNMDDVHLPSKDYTVPLIIDERTFVPRDDQLQAQDPTWITGRAMPEFENWGGEDQLWFTHVYPPNQNPNVDAGANDYGRWDYGPWFWPPYTGLQYPAIVDDQGRSYPSIPNPTGTPETFCDTPLVNGVPYPFMNVEARPYTFKILNACNDRTLSLSLFNAVSNDKTSKTLDASGNLVEIHLDDGEVPMVPAVMQPGWDPMWPNDSRDGGVPDPTSAGAHIYQIQNECGFIPEVVDFVNRPVNYEYNRRNIVVLDTNATNLFLCTAERASVVIDFSHYQPGDVVILYNDCPAPNCAFDPKYDLYTDCPNMTDGGGPPSTIKGYGPNTRTLLQFRIVAPTKVASPDMINNLDNTVKNIYVAVQDAPIIPQSIYNKSIGLSNTLGDSSLYVDNFGRIEQNIMQFKNVNCSAIATADVNPDGTLKGINIVDGGSNYIPDSTVVVIEPPPGNVKATAKAVVTKDPNNNAFIISAINVDNGGSGYLTAPNVYISDPNAEDAQAIAVAVVNSIDGSISKIVVNDSHFGYYTVPNVSIDAPELSAGNSAIAHAVLLGNGQIEIVIDNPGSLYDNKYRPAVTISPPDNSMLPMLNFSTASAHAIITNGVVTSIVVDNAGFGYDPNNLPTIFLDPPYSASFNKSDIIFGNGSINSIETVNRGLGYTMPTIKKVRTQVTSSIQNRVTTYTRTITTTTVTNGSSTTSTVTNLNWGVHVISDNTVTTFIPIVTASLTGGFGDGAIAVPNMSSDRVAKISLKNHGNGYLVEPIITIDPPLTPISQGGVQATAVAVIDRGQIVNINVTNPGAGYIYPVDTTTGLLTLPNITIQPIVPQNVSLAQIACEVSTGCVDVINVINGGYGYVDEFGVSLVSAPVTFTSSSNVKSQTGFDVAEATAYFVNGCVDRVVVTKQGSMYSITPTVTLSIPNIKPMTTASFSVVMIEPSSIQSVTVTNHGHGYSSVPQVVFNDPNFIDQTIPILDPNGNNINNNIDAIFGCQCDLVNSVQSISAVNLSSVGAGYDPLNPPKVTILDKMGLILSYDLKHPAIQELFELTYGRMNATFGIELPNTNASIQTTIPYGFADPPTEKIQFNVQAVGPVRNDGTQIWKVTHNGVDVHSVHIHLMQIQLLNRVGWDGMITPPEPSEFGWKETMKFHPLQDTFVAMRAVPPPMKTCAVPNSIRNYDTTMMSGMSSTTAFTNIGIDGAPITITNDSFDYGHEYMWHCHILGHEENDMMRPICMYLNYEKPYVPTLSSGVVSDTSTTVDIHWSIVKSKPAHLNYDPKDFYNMILERSVNGLFGNGNSIVVADVNGQNRNLYVNCSPTFTDAIGSSPGIFYYRLTTQNSFGLSYSNVILLLKLKPTITCVETSGRITINWTALPASLTNYIFNKTDNGILSSTTLSSSTLSNYITPIAGHTYTFNVRARFAGQLTDISNVITVVWNLCNSPSSLSYNSSLIQWSPVTTVVNQPPLTNYLLSVTSANGTAVSSRLIGPAVLSYSYSPLLNSTFIISVSALNLVGTSTPAATKTVVWQKPSVSTNVSANATTISWVAPVLLSNVPAVTGYNVYNNGVLLGSSVTNTLAWVPVVGTIYNLTVVAVNMVGLSLGSSPYVLNWSVPNAHTNVSANASQITWSEVLIPSEPAVTRYNVYNNGVLLGSSVTTTLAWVPVVGTIYNLTVVAVNMVGLSLGSSPYVLNWSVPNAHTNVSANASQITWSEVLIPSEPAVTRYNVYNNGVLLGSSVTTTLAWVPVVGTIYNLTVVAVNMVGSSLPSVSFLIKWSPPPAPVITLIDVREITWSENIVNEPAVSVFEIFNGSTSLGTSNVQSFIWTPVIGNTYNISIKATNIVGSSLSAPVSFEYLLPKAPTNVVANGTTITWNAPVASVVSGYNVFVDTVLIGTNVSQTSLPWVPSGAGLHTIQVYAVNFVGQSLTPGINYLNWSVPNIPIITSVNNTSIKWSEQLITYSPAITYIVTSNGIVLSGVIVTNVTGTVATSSITWTPIVETTYNIVVTATNAVGSSLSASFSYLIPNSVPSAPTNIFMSTSRIVNWTQNGIAATSYQVSYTVTRNGSTGVARVATVTTNSYTMTNAAVTNSTYNFQITAFNEVGSSPVAIQSILWNFSRPVTGLAYSNSLISWNAPAIVTNGIDASSYTLTVITTNIANVTTTNTYANITGLSYAFASSVNNNYAFNVVAVNVVGSSTMTSITYSTRVPNVPRTVNYNRSSKVITWSASTAITGASATTNYNLVITNRNTGATIVTTSVNVTNYTFFAAITNTNYTVSITATNANGTSNAVNYNFTG